jgi:hypothetical protein
MHLRPRANEPNHSEYPMKRNILVCSALVALVLGLSSLIASKSSRISEQSIPKFAMVHPSSALVTSQPLRHVNPEGAFSGSTLVELAAVLEQPLADQPLEAFDAALRKFMDDSSVPRSEKLNYLWNTARGMPGEKGDVALDILRAMRPIELAPEIIAAYEESENSRKPTLIDVLRVCAIGDGESLEKPEQQAEFLDKAIQIQKFLGEKIRTSTPEQILDLDLVKALCDVMAPEEAIAELNRLSAQWFGDSNGVEGRDELMSEWYRNAIYVASSDESLQKTTLPKILNQLRQFDSSNRLGVDDYLCALAEKGNFSGSAGEDLLTFLGERPPQAGPSDKFSRWINAQIAVAAGDDQNQRGDLLASCLQNETQPLNLASAVIYADDVVFNSVPPETKRAVARTLATVNSVYSSEAATFIGDALDRLAHP